MADLIASSFKTYFESLTATNDIISEFGTTLTHGTNLFIGFDEDVDESIVITPYGGEPPSVEGDRQNPAIQIGVKSASRARSFKTSQAIINNLHGNKSICTGRVQARDSSPIPLKVDESGRTLTTITNYYIKHVKL